MRVLKGLSEFAVKQDQAMSADDSKKSERTGVVSDRRDPSSSRRV
jgi:hypothetical protein